MNKYLTLGALLCLLLVSMQGCVPRQTSPVAPQFETLQSENIHLDIVPDAPPKVYVSLRDKTDKVFGLRAMTEASLTAKGYEITNNPSRAGYILQIDVMAVGPADAQAVREAVPLGYGGALQISGTDATVMVVDVLLALRNKPQPLKTRSHVLRAASSRSAVASYQMRTATMITGVQQGSHAKKNTDFTTNVKYFEDSLVKTVTDMFPPAPARPESKKKGESKAKASAPRS